MTITNGSPKQIAWAIEIKEDHIKLLNNYYKICIKRIESSLGLEKYRERADNFYKTIKNNIENLYDAIDIIEKRTKTAYFGSVYKFNDYVFHSYELPPVKEVEFNGKKYSLENLLAHPDFSINQRGVGTYLLTLQDKEKCDIYVEWKRVPGQEIIWDEFEVSRIRS